MSKDVTFEQAKKLNDLGYTERSEYTYLLHQKSGNHKLYSPLGRMDYNQNNNRDNSNKIAIYYSAPTTSEALDWVREEKGIECGVLPICESFAKDNTDGSLSMSTMFVGYDYNFFDKSSDKGEIVNMVTYSTHPLASSALLDAVLTYLEQK